MTCCTVTGAGWRGEVFPNQISGGFGIMESNQLRSCVHPRDCAVLGLINRAQRGPETGKKGNIVLPTGNS